MEAFTTAFGAALHAAPPRSKVSQLLHARRPQPRSDGPLITPIFLDGGLATECERRKINIDHPLWSTKALLDNPREVAAIHGAFFSAGADIASTATYQSSDAGAAKFGTSVADVAAAAVGCVRHGAASSHRHDVPLMVGGSVGPYGSALGGGAEYTGKYEKTHAEFVAFHTPRVKALLDAGVDVLLLETFPRVDEAVAALDAVAALYAERGWTPAEAGVGEACDAGNAAASRPVETAALPPVSLSFTLAAGPTGSDAHGSAMDGKATPIRVSSGEPLWPAVEAAARYPFVRWVGANCSTPHAVATLVEQWGAPGSRFAEAFLRPAVAGALEQEGRSVPHNPWADIPRGVVLYPNSGEKWVADDGSVGVGRWDASHLAAEEAEIGGRLAAHWLKWRAALERIFAPVSDAAGSTGAVGTVLLGGCCRTYPEDIERLRANVERDWPWLQ
jgi:homocysteine S-methyltransferase